MMKSLFNTIKHIFVFAIFLPYNIWSQVYTFNNCGNSGSFGPTQAQVNSEYAGTNLAGNVTSVNGIQNWLVPVAGNYRIEVWGAEGYGPFAGKGAYMSGEFNLTGGQQLQILVGQQGGCCVGAGTNQYGGGGGSFVVTSTNTPLIIAGGGGGARYNTAILPSSNGSTSTSGNSGTGTTSGAGGTGGNGGSQGGTGGGGGGFLTDGTASPYGGKSFLNGGNGGAAASNGGRGGFGGGAGCDSWDNGRGGGGGGYSGGGGAGSSTTAQQVGGGGGSFNSGLNQTNTSGVRSGHGLVVITLLSPPVPNDAGIGQIQNANNFCVGSQQVSAIVNNNGTTVIDSVLVSWSVNNVLQGSAWTVFNPVLGASGGTNSTRTVVLGNYNFPFGPYSIKAWTSMPNNAIDGNFINDTFSYSGHTKLSGIITINNALPTSGNNFNTFTEFTNVLNNYGVCGPLVVNVANNATPYNERIILGNIPGASNVNTIRFNGNGATVQYNANSTTNMQMIVMDATKYVTIDNLRIKTLNTSYGWGAAIANGAQYDTITNCFFDLSSITGTSSTNSNGITITGSLTSPTTGGDNRNIYIGSNILDLGPPTTSAGAYYGISIYGSNTSTFGADSIYVIDNEIKNFYYYGIYTYNTNELYLVGNEIHRPLRTGSTTVYGIRTYYMGTGKIVGNKIHDLTAPTYSHTNTVYGMYINYPNYSSSITKRLFEVTNNAIYNVGGGGTNYLLYCYGGDSALIAHNTIDVNLTNSTSTSTMYGIYIYNSTNSYFVKNNTVSYTGGNQGTKYGIYSSSSNTFVNNNGLQNNNVYLNSTSSGAQNRIYYNSTAYANLATFNAAFPTLDVLGVEANPLYTNYAAGDLTPTSPLLLMQGENLNGLVPKDIRNVNRPTPPTIGAWDLAPEDNDNAGVDSLIAPNGNFCSSIQQLRVRVRNFGNNNIDTVQIHYSVNGVGRAPVYNYTTIVGKGNAPANQAIVTLGSETFHYGINYNIKVWTFNPNNMLDDYNEDDTLSFTISPTSTLPVSIGADTIICDNVSYNLSAGIAQGFSYVWDNLSSAPTRFIYQGGTYYVTKTDIATGCLGTDTIHITTKPAPIVDLGSDQAICNGDTLILDVGSGNANNSVLWNDGNTDHQRPIWNAGIYNVIVTGVNGCIATDEFRLNYKDNPSVDGINAILTLDGSYNFNVRNPQFIQYAIWDYGDGSPNDTGLAVNHKFRDNGLYTIKVKLISECLSTIDSNFVYEETLDVFDATSIDKLDKNFIKIYPNPAKDYIIINSDESRINVVKVYNAVGQVVLNQSFGAPERSITLSTKTLSSGIYHIVLKTDVGNYSKKIEVIK